jgi:uncharacterized protein YbjQ (UPF0145 family)
MSRTDGEVMGMVSPSGSRECAVVTFESIDGYRVVRSHGYVSGTATRQRSLLLDGFRGLGALIGLAGSEWITDAEALRRPALEALRAQAGQRGANAVINVQFHASERPDGSSTLTAFGEAVVLVKEQPARA